MEAKRYYVTSEYETNDIDGYDAGACVESVHDAMEEARAAAIELARTMPDYGDGWWRVDVYDWTEGDEAFADAFENGLGDGFIHVDMDGGH